MKLHSVFALLLALAVATSLVACGKKGDPTLPKGQKDDFPRSYPTNTDPQSGVFSG
jgi:predicted small lipoprotein YifL